IAYCLLPAACLSAAVPDVHHVAVLHYVFLAFQAQRAAGARSGFGARVEQRIPANGFSADEVMLEVGVDCAGGLRSLRADRDRPSAALVFACGKKADQAEQLVAFANQ